MNKDFLEVITERRSIRRFHDREIPDDLVRDILQLGMYAPTPCNQQLWRFVVIKEKKLKEKLVNESACSTLILRVPVVVAIMYDNWNYKESIQSSSMAVQNILLSANYYGIGSLAMNSFGAETRVKNILKIPERYTICCFVCLGYPAEMDTKSSPVPRRNISQILDYNYFSQRDEIPYTYEPEMWTLSNITEYQRFFCRKTFLGKEMDIFHQLEKSLVKDILSKIPDSDKEEIIDLLSYDGNYLKEFPNRKIISIDLCKETSEYTQEAVKINTKKDSGDFEFRIYEPDKKLLYPQEVSAVTLIYKAERISAEILKRLMEQSYATLKKDGKIIIISRRGSLMFLLFYNILKFLFGEDIRKTGIYSFFGPYKPINTKQIKGILNSIGFTSLSEKRYFVFPAFFDQALQMYLQYKKSEGTTYLHRIRRENVMTKIIAHILKIQGLRQSMFGSVSVIEANK